MTGVTEGSAGIRRRLHASVDAFPNFLLWPLLPAALAVMGYGVYVGYHGLVVGMGIAALLIIAATRGRLGYERNRREAEEGDLAIGPRWGNAGTESTEC